MTALAPEIPAVILSAGSEIVSAALVEEFAAQGIPIVLIALGRRSLLRDTVPGLRYQELPWPPTSTAEGADALIEMLRRLSGDRARPWPVFATEDGGLRLLMEQRERLRDFLAIGGATKLRMGGLDKAELFEALVAAGLESYGAPTRVIDEPGQIPVALAALGGDCILKPSLKPLSMRMAGMPAKILASSDYPNAAALLDAAASVWDLSERWIVQQRLITPRTGEVDWWGIAGGPGSAQRGMIAYEHWKQPRVGGSGCWVCIQPDYIAELEIASRLVLDTIGFVGVVELPYLRSEAGSWHLLEMNPRPWLQIGLTWRAGVPLASAGYRLLLGQDPGALPKPSASCWVNVERLAIEALSGEYGRRWETVRTAWSAWRNADTVAMYDSSLRHLRRRWIGRLTRGAVRRLLVR